ncbi:MAG: hypothetical protein ACPG5B_14450 [Chitinophagales bacterium]
MRNKNIFNYIFLVGLVILIINDHFLKEALGNWFTGKLSDFAGLLIFPLFLKYLFDTTNRKAIFITLTGFLFWKSPFSQTFIDGFNTISAFQIGRVIDYSDFLAFLILPFSFYVLKNIEKYTIKLPHFNFQNKWAVNSLLCISFVAFTATSQDEDGFIEPESLISLACTSAPFEAQVGNGNIFIPTIFTPDGNGINDFFQISADSNILQIDTFTIIHFTSFDTVFHQLNISDIIPTNGFDGVVNDTIRAGYYAYVIVVTSDNGVSQSFTGELTSIPCQDTLGLPRPQNLDNCAFSTQHDFINGYDSTIESNEALDCFID